jgi:hypothetical protein
MKRYRLASIDEVLARVPDLEVLLAYKGDVFAMPSQTRRGVTRFRFVSCSNKMDSFTVFTKNRDSEWVDRYECNPMGGDDGVYHAAFPGGMKSLIHFVDTQEVVEHAEKIPAIMMFAMKTYGNRKNEAGKYYRKEEFKGQR